MKPGEEFTITNETLLRPLIGKLIEVTMNDGETVKARVIAVHRYTSNVKVVPELTKE